MCPSQREEMHHFVAFLPEPKVTEWRLSPGGAQVSCGGHQDAEKGEITLPVSGLLPPACLPWALPSRPEDTPPLPSSPLRGDVHYTPGFFWLVAGFLGGTLYTMKR